MVIKPSDEYFIDITTNNTSVFCFDFMNKLFKVGRLQDAKRTINARILDKEEAAHMDWAQFFPCAVSSLRAESKWLLQLLLIT